MLARQPLCLRRGRLTQTRQIGSSTSALPPCVMLGHCGVIDADVRPCHSIVQAVDRSQSDCVLRNKPMERDGFVRRRVGQIADPVAGVVEPPVQLEDPMVPEVGRRVRRRPLTD